MERRYRLMVRHVEGERERDSIITIIIERKRER